MVASGISFHDSGIRSASECEDGGGGAAAARGPGRQSGELVTTFKLIKTEPSRAAVA